MGAAKLPKFGKHPVRLICPSCGNQITTKIKVKSTMKTHMLAVSLVMMCLWFIAPFVYCLKCFRSVEHYCPVCGRLLGVYNE